jgi:hypothetical protein
MTIHNISIRKTQSGAILIVALVFLGVITLLSVSSMRAASTSIHMAGNEESRFVGLQRAQAMTEALLSNPAATPVVGAPGFTSCTAGEAGCDRYGLPLPPPIAAEVAAGNMTARVEQLSSPDRTPPRVIESSIDKFSVATFELTATYDRTDERLGRVTLSEGMMILIPKL